MIQKFACGKLGIEGAYLLDPFVDYDERGYFIKDYSDEIFQDMGIFHTIKEVFYTNSHKGVIRAIHFQREKQQPKLVRCVYGQIFDVVVDLRKNSPTFGEWEGYILSEENKKEILIPAGCGHGYLVMEDSIVSYKCAEKFYGEYDDGIIWNDAQINISWPLESVDKIILSEKDKKLGSFQEFMKANKGGFEL